MDALAVKRSSSPFILSLIYSTFFNFSLRVYMLFLSISEILSNLRLLFLSKSLLFMLS